MRILYFTRADSVHDQRFLAALAESGHEGFVLRLHPGSFPTPGSVQVVEWGGSQSQLSESNIEPLTRELEQVLKVVQPDLVHAGPLQDLAFLVARTGFTPLLSMSWGFDLMHDVLVSPDAAEKARFALGHSARLITDAHCSAAQAVRLGFDPEKICIFARDGAINVFCSACAAGNPTMVWMCCSGRSLKRLKKTTTCA